MSLSVAMITCIYFGVLIIRCVSLLGSTVFLPVTWLVAVITERLSAVLLVVIVLIIKLDRFVESMWLLVLVRCGNGGFHCDRKCCLVDIVVA